MAIKVAILRTGEQIISDMKEIISDDNIVAYLLKDPHTLQINSPILISDERTRERSIEISLSKWILITEDTEIAVPINHVVTIVEPIDSVVNMYKEKLDGQGNIPDEQPESDNTD